jgi:hypothetical protein
MRSSSFPKSVNVVFILPFLTSFTCSDVGSQEPGPEAAINRLVSISENGNRVSMFLYNPDGSLKDATYILPGNNNQTQDELRFTYTYVAGRIIECSSLFKGMTTDYQYHYNSKNQLESVSGSNNLDVHYKYNAKGKISEEEVERTSSFYQRTLYTYTWNANNVSKIAEETYNSSYLQRRAEYVYSYGKARNPEPATPGRTLQNFLGLPGFRYSANNVVKVEFHNLSGEESYAATLNYSYNAKKYPVKASVKSDRDDWNGKTYTFEYK